MLPLDPVDLTNPAPFDAFSYYAHIAIGLIGWLAALIALATRKGSAPHIWAGRIFIGAIVAVTLTSLALIAVRFAPPLLVAGLSAVYAVATAFLALRPGTAKVRRYEIGLFLFELAVLGIFLFIAGQAVLAGRIPAIALVVIPAIPIILLAGDINFFAKQRRRAALRVQRHMARMIWALVLAVRAPLAEFYADFGLPIGLLLVGPIVAGALLILAFRAKAGRIAQDVHGDTLSESQAATG